MSRPLLIDLDDLGHACPFHLLLAADHTLISWGPSVQALCPGLQVGQPLARAFAWVSPAEGLAVGPVELQSLHSQLRLRGRITPLRDDDRLLFHGAPRLTTVDELQRASALQAALDPDDPLAELFGVLAEQRRAFTELQGLSQRSRAQDAESRKLALIAARTDNAVILTDRRGRIEWVNHGFERLTGWTLAEVIGATPGSILQGPGSDPEVIAQMRRAIHQGAPFRVEIENYTRDQRPYFVSVDAQPILDDLGEISHYMAIERDITVERQAAEHLREALARAESANQLKSKFLASVSHELRTPLTAILGFAGLVDRPFATAQDRSHWAAAIRRNGEHLLALLNDILDLSKIEAGQMTLAKAPCDPLTVIEDSVSVLRSMAEEKGLTLTLDLPDELPATVETDRLRFQQVLLNLLSNAVKYTESGGITVAVSVETDPHGLVQLILHVIDTGIGIPEEVQHLLFSPFRRLHAERNTRIAGVGLGLSIAQQLARLLGGDITLRSAVGQGSVFTFALTIGPAEEVQWRQIQPVAAPTAASRGPTPRHLHGLRVLLVEDGEENQELVSILLAEQGVFVSCAENGLAGVELTLAAQNLGQPYDAILMDMQMPVMDGYTAAAELRRQGVRTPIIALTAHAMSGDRDRCLASGCNDYVSKPIVEDQLFGAIAAVLPRRASPPPSAPSPTARLEALIAQFRASLPPRAQALRQHILAGELPLIERMAHDLRGSAPSFGEPELGRTAASCEDALRHGQVEVGLQLAAQLALALDLPR